MRSYRAHCARLRSFAEIPIDIIRCPIPRKIPEPHPAMKRRIGPRGNVLHKPMLDWIPVNVASVPSKVGFVPDLMFPESSLPQSRFMAPHARLRNVFRCGRVGNAAGQAFDQPPAHREVRIAFGQSPDAVQMVRQQHGGIERERTGSSHGVNGLTQSHPDWFGRQVIVTPVGANREEVSSSRHWRATTSSHFSAS